MSAPVADRTENDDCTPQVFLLDLNVLLMSVTAQKSDPESHCEIIIHPPSQASFCPTAELLEVAACCVGN